MCSYEDFRCKVDPYWDESPSPSPVPKPLPSPSPSPSPPRNTLPRLKKELKLVTYLFDDLPVADDVPYENVIMVAGIPIRTIFSGYPFSAPTMLIEMVDAIKYSKLYNDGHVRPDGLILNTYMDWTACTLLTEIVSRLTADLEPASKYTASAITIQRIWRKRR